MPFDILVKQNATVDDTLRLIVNAVNVCSKSPFVLRVAETIAPGAGKDEFIRALFDYICRNGKYELDTPGTEEVWTPEKTLREGKFDCKKVSVFLASVLKAAGIEPILKHVYYEAPNGGLQDYTHIYVIVPNPDLRTYITVDPTNDCKYNSEVQSSKQTLYFLNGTKMDLHMMGRAKPAVGDRISMGAFSSSMNNAADSLNADMHAAAECLPGGNTICGSNQYFSYTTAEAVAHAAKVPALAIPRNAFLGLLYLGRLLANTPLKLNLASHIAYAWNANPNAFRKLWWSLGGEADASAIQTALKKIVGGVIYGPPVQSYDRPWIIRDANYGHMGATVGQGPETLAALAAAAVPLGVILKFLKDHGVIKEGQTDPPPPPGTPPPVDPKEIPGGTPPGTDPNPSAGSFATHSIDNAWDLLNFIKAGLILEFAACMDHTNFIAVNIILSASFLYAVRKKIFAW